MFRVLSDLHPRTTYWGQTHLALKLVGESVEVDELSSDPAVAWVGSSPMTSQGWEEDGDLMAGAISERRGGDIFCQTEGKTGFMLFQAQETSKSSGNTGC